MEKNSMINTIRQKIKTFYQQDSNLTPNKTRVSFLHQWVIVFTIHILLEVVFLLVSQLGLDIRTLTRILLFSITSTSIVISIAYWFKTKLSHAIVSLYLLSNTIFALAQLGYQNYIGSFFSFRTVLTKIGDVGEYTVDFLMYFRIEFLLVLIPIVLYGIAIKTYLNKHTMMFDIRRWATVMLMALMIHGMAILSLSWWQSPTSAISLHELYFQPKQIDSALRQFGVSRFFLRDLVYTFKEDDDQIIITPITPPNIEVPPDLSRDIDDTIWKTLMENENNEAIKTIDDYLMNRPITPKNEMTGVFKDKNVIYVMVESLDHVAIDPLIAPTLTMMMEQGWYFDSFYSPLSACSTGDSELMSITSILSIPGVCSHDGYYTNRYSSSLFELFKSEGYYVSSYHNYPDWYYMRNVMHRNMGSQAYYDFNGLNMDPWVAWPNWPSDVDLMDLAMDRFVEYDKFFSFIITVNMHNPYDIASNYGDKYYDEIKKLYPEASDFILRYKSKAKETDQALAVMLQRLEEEGKLDDTVIVLFSDHHMLKTPYDIIDAYSDDVDRLIGYNIHHTPMIIYNPTIESKTISTIASTKDLVPTMANLFDLYHDPRVYVGVDIFSDDVDHYVLFQNGGWLIQQGFYNPVMEQFNPFDGEDMIQDEEILRMNQISRSMYELSEALFQTDYFRYRSFVKKPVFDLQSIQ